jgi:hypothetical protein
VAHGARLSVGLLRHPAPRLQTWCCAATSPTAPRLQPRPWGGYLRGMDSQTTAAPRLTKLKVAILFLGLALFAWAIRYGVGNEIARRWPLLAPALSFTLPALWITDWILRRHRK